jgi:hypothetical protein
MKIKYFIPIFICLFLWNCAIAPAPREIMKSFPIEKPYDRVWSAVIETFAELQLPIQNMEKDSGLIITDWIDFTGQKNEDYCDCGGLGINTEVRRSGKLNVFVKKINENSCEIQVNTMFEQMIRFGDTAPTKRNCVSTGNLEAEMFRLIKEKTI